MNVHHSVDWKGLTFMGKVLLAVMVMSGAGYFSLLYASQSHATNAGAPSLILIQETHPAPAKSLALTLSTTTSTRVLNSLTIADAVPPAGKFIVADLMTMILTLYENGSAVAKYSILARGGPESPFGVPAGYYTVQTKDPEHVNTNDQIHQPWSVQFYGNYSLHGAPYRRDGSPADLSDADDSLRLGTDDAELVYDFADEGTGIFVYGPPHAPPASLTLDAVPVPALSASSYIVADIDTGDVLLEQDADAVHPLASSTALMSALAADETIPADAKAPVLRRESLTASFVSWMNAKAKALDMTSTHFAESMGTSTETVGTASDLVHLAAYLTHNKLFILTDAQAMVTHKTMVSVVPVPINGAERRAVVIVLDAKDARADVSALASWFTKSAEQGAEMAATACVTCAAPPPYRKLQL